MQAESPGRKAELKNPVYDLLVNEDPSDIEALVAYALYKKHKRDWAKDFLERKGREPTPEDDAAFAESVTQRDQLARYRRDATNMLLAFAENITDGRRPEIEKAAIAGRVEDAAREIEKTGNLRRQVSVAVISTLMVTGILVVLTIAASLFGIDPVDGVRALVAE